MSSTNDIYNLRFSEFVEDLTKHSLGQLTEIKSASRVHREQWKKSGVPFFRSSDVVSAFKAETNKKVYISTELFEELSNKSGRVKQNDVLVTGGGSIGIPYLIDNNEPLYFKDADLLWFKDSDSIYGPYLYQFLLSPIFRRHLQKITHTGTISHYTIEQGKSTPINLPIYKEQQKIADFLSSVDKKISLLKEKHALLQQYKKGVLQKLFKQEIRFKDENGNAFPDWQEYELSEIVTPIKRRASNAVKAVMTISAGKGFLSQEERFSQVIAGTSLDKYTHLKKGEFSYNRGNSKRYTYGCIYKLEDKEEALVPYVYRSFTLDKGNAEFFANLFKFKYLDRQLRRLISSSARMDGLLNINEKNFYQVTVPFPSDAEQEKIANFLEAIEAKINLVKKQIELTQTFKKGLLQQMFV